MSNPLKQCSKCKRWLPESTEYFYRSENRLRNQCKVCDNARSKEYYKANSDRLIARTKQRAAGNKSAVSEKNKKYRAANADRLNQYARDYRSKNRDIIIASNKAWREKNGKRIRVLNQRRRTRQFSLPSTLTATQWQRCLEYWNGRCAYCGRPAGFFHVTAADHFVALSDPNSPGTVVENMVPACHGAGSCNNQKGPRPPAEWLESKFGPRKAKQILKRISDYFEWAIQQPT